MSKEKTAEEILQKHVGVANSYWCKPVLDAMNQFADQRYTRDEVMAIMDRVKKEAESWVVKGAPIEHIKGDIALIDLTKYLNK